MKLVVLASMFISLSSFAAVNVESVCEELTDQANQNCAEYMCQDWVEREGEPVTDANVADCIKNSGGDLWEGAGICVYDGGELDKLISEYNTKNPSAQIKNCDDY